MGKTKQTTNKTNYDRTRNVQQKYKQKKKEPRVPKVNKAAELIELKKQAKIEKERKTAQFRKKRLEKTKVMSKKTSKGQPLMKNRIECLLKQIQEMKQNK